MAGNTSTPGASVIGRAFAVLNAFHEQHRSLSLASLARRTGLPAATVHRLCAELVAAGALSRRDSGEYVVGRRLWSTAMLAPVQTGLRDLAAPFLHDIHAATLATVHLAVRDRTEVLYLDRVSGGRSAPVVSRVGGKLPLHCTGVGKVLLAHAPADVASHVFSHLVRYTPFTVVQPATLALQLERARRDGYAVTTDEMNLRRDRNRYLGVLQGAAAGVNRALGSLADRPSS